MGALGMMALFNCRERVLLAFATSCMFPGSIWQVAWSQSSSWWPKHDVTNPTTRTPFSKI